MPNSAAGSVGRHRRPGAGPRSGSTTRASGPSRRSSRSSQASPPTKISTSTRPSTSSVGPADGIESISQAVDGSTDKRTLRASGPGTNGSNPRASGPVILVLRRVPEPGMSVTGPRSTSSSGADAVDPEPSHTAGALAPGVDVPVALGAEQPEGQDLPVGHPVGGCRVVGDGQVPLRVERLLDQREQGGRVQLDGHLLAPEGTVELGQCPGQRTVLVTPRYRQQGAGRGGQGEPSDGTEAPGSGQGRSHPGGHGRLGDHDLHELVRRVGRDAAAGGHLELGDQGLGREIEAGGHLVDGRLADLGQPGQDGQEAAEPSAGVDHRSSGLHPHRWPAMASSRSTTAARTASGANTSAWSSRSSTQRISAS